MIIHVVSTKTFDKQFEKLPYHVQMTASVWLRTVREEGLDSAKKRKGYRDKKLKGNRAGQRSIRLNRSYRLIYEEKNDGTIHLITLLEAHKHEY